MLSKFLKIFFGIKNLERCPRLDLQIVGHRPNVLFDVYPKIFLAEHQYIRN